MLTRERLEEIKAELKLVVMSGDFREQDAILELIAHAEATLLPGTKPEFTALTNVPSRAEIAARIMAHLARDYEMYPEHAADTSLRLADALISALNKPTEAEQKQPTSTIPVTFLLCLSERAMILKALENSFPHASKALRLKIAGNDFTA